MVLLQTEISFGNGDLKPPVLFQARRLSKQGRHRVDDLLPNFLCGCDITGDVVNECCIDRRVAFVVADAAFITAAVVMKGSFQIARLRKRLPLVLVNRAGDTERFLIRCVMQIVAVR